MATEGTEPAEWPQRGDRVMFPDAPEKWNRSNEYDVDHVTPDVVTVSFCGEGSYEIGRKAARRLGMRVVR
jgi:hypothetical protein